jgi:KaiC/GvpD/RAD55 family RecA-like ATPase
MPAYGANGVTLNDLDKRNRKWFLARFIASGTVRFRVDEVGACRYVRFVEIEKETSAGSSDEGIIIRARDGASNSSSKIEFKPNPHPALVVNRKNALAA